MICNLPSCYREHYKDGKCKGHYNQYIRSQQRKRKKRVVKEPCEIQDVFGLLNKAWR